MKLKPLHNRIVVKQQDTSKQTSTGIFLVSNKEEGVVEGEVVAVGPGKYQDDNTFLDVVVSVGDRVLFNVGSGYKVEIEKTSYHMLTDDEIVVVLE
jgi:chaperonin GroES